jgi:hypothetical protein
MYTATLYTKKLATVGTHQIEWEFINSFEGNIWVCECLLCFLPVCQSAEPVCKEGFTVTCKTGNHSGCDCNYIHLCHPNVSECFQTNVSHTKSCGFWWLAPMMEFSGERQLFLFSFFSYTALFRNYCLLFMILLQMGKSRSWWVIIGTIWR